MRTSRVSRETAKLVDALTPSLPAHGRRSSRLSVFSAPNTTTATTTTPRPNGSTQAVAKQETHSNNEEDSSGLSSANTTDIEDLLSPGPSRKRKRGAKATESTTRETTVKGQKPITEKKTNARRLPARKITSQNGESSVEPPSNWETIYSTVKDMREKNPTAPVDTMGCSELYWRSSTPQERRFHILVALMLSSQTKDTVTAVAMQRLHTELGSENDPDSNVNQIIKSEEPETKDNKGLDNRTWDQTKQQSKSTLTLENILAVSTSYLNNLIGAVGFHNNKTKYIKATAQILRDTYSSDIPSTATELMKLPGVGPKMAYLCMSAAWGKDEGIGVDVHVHRITNLWGWHKTKTPEETRAALEGWLPREKWHEINKLLVGLGQTVCLPVARRCGECGLAGTGLCKGEIKGWAAKEGLKMKRKTTAKKTEAEVDGGEIVKEESKVEVKLEEEEAAA